MADTLATNKRQYLVQWWQTTTAGKVERWEPVVAHNAHEAVKALLSSPVPDSYGVRWTDSGGDITAAVKVVATGESITVMRVKGTYSTVLVPT